MNKTNKNLCLVRVERGRVNNLILEIHMLESDKCKFKNQRRELESVGSIVLLQF